MSMHRRPACAEQGTALIAAMLLVVLLSATGLGLALTCSLEPAVAGNFDSSWAAFAAAESAVTLAAHDLAATADWDAALAGTWRPSLLAFAGAHEVVAGTVPPIGIAALTNLANCLHAEPCSAGELTAATVDRPWGRNNPAWRVAGRVRSGPGLTLDASLPFEAVVWVGDDPAESDGNPLSDAVLEPSDPGPAPPGRGRLLVRAEAFGPRRAHATVEVTASRPAPGGPVSLQRWRVW